MWGLRFDASAIAIINLLFSLASLLPFTFVNRGSYQAFLKWFFTLTNLPLLWLNIADCEYYKFIGRRTNFEVFSLGQDLFDQLGQLALHYWYLILMYGFVIYLFVKYLPQNPKSNITQKSTLQTAFRLFIGLVVGGLHILIFRGGLQEKPLRINQAFVQNDIALGNLCLNSPFTFLTTIDAIGTQKVHYFSATKDFWPLIKPDTSLTGFTHEKPQNVIIFILESFGSEYTGNGNPWKGYTPFLDSLAKAGLSFPNNYANGRSSIDAVPSILATIPPLMAEPYITCTYQSNRINGLSTVLRANGYATSFFHGAKNGSMGFEGFSQVAGFQKYYGLNEYPSEQKNKNFDGQWGIFDEPFLQFFAQKISQEKKPFLSAIFTLSSHQPYTIPVQYQGKFPKGVLPLHESLGYADYALKRFFETAQKQDWYANTLFILTADHTQQNVEPRYASELGAYRTPLILFHPDPEKMTLIRSKSDTARITQQADISATVTDFLNLRTPQPLPFGQSVFSKNEGFSIHFYEGFYRLILKNYYLKMTEQGEVSLWRTMPYVQKSVAINDPVAQKNLQRKLEAFIQYHHNGLIENSWVK